MKDGQGVNDRFFARQSVPAPHLRQSRGDYVPLIVVDAYSGPCSQPLARRYTYLYHRDFGQDFAAERNNQSESCISDHAQ